MAALLKCWRQYQLRLKSWKLQTHSTIFSCTIRDETMLPFQASDCRSTVSALLMIVHTLSALPFQTISFLFSWECTFIGLYNAALYKPHNLIFCFKKPYVFRCASISCTDDRHRLTHRNWRFGILNVYSCRTTPLVFYPVGIFVWSVWSP